MNSGFDLGLMKKLWFVNRQAPDAEASGSQRTARAALSGISSAAARAIQLGASFISIPMAVHYLGNERFGLWMTIFSLVTILSFADFGIGNGLLNVVADAYGRGDSEASKQAVSSAFVALSLLASVLSATMVGVYPFVHWAEIFNVHSAQARAEAAPTVIAFFACFVIALPFGIVQRIQLGQQEGYLNGIWSIAGTVVGLLGLIAAIHARMSLPYLVVAIAGGPSAALIANSLYLFARRPWLRPKISSYSRPVAARILKTGALFFILQIAMAAGYQSDNLVIAHILGPESVTRYAVALRIFQCIPTFLGFFMLALWPAYGEASARGDYGWITSTYRKTLLLNAAIAVPIALLLVASAPSIIGIWVGRNLEPGWLLLAALAAYCITNTLVGPISAIMNGMHMLRFQAISWSVMAVMNLGLSILLTKLIGVSGVAFGSAVTQLAFILIPSILYLRARLNELHRLDLDECKKGLPVRENC